MTVDRSEVNQMAKFLMASRELGSVPQATSMPDYGDYGDLPESAPAELREHGIVPRTAQSIAPPVPLNTGDVSEMKAILQRFHKAANNVVSDAPNDRPLRESLITEELPSGVRIGRWEIVANQIGKKKYYDVAHAVTNERIASELLLYEAAYGLVRILNEGGKINSPDVLNLLRAEQDYAGAIHDMRLFKHHLAKSPDSPRAAIYEDRYSDAKRKAISARDRVEKLSGTF